MTSSFEIAMSLLVQENDNCNKVFLDSYKHKARFQEVKSPSIDDNLTGIEKEQALNSRELHFIRIKNKQPKYNTGLPIHRHIICGGIINLCNLYKKIHTPTNQVICFNTDSIMIKGEPNEEVWKHMTDYRS